MCFNVQEVKDIQDISIINTSKPKHAPIALTLLDCSSMETSTIPNTPGHLEDLKDLSTSVLYLRYLVGYPQSITCR
jgi:hypothetical protein